MKLSPRAWRHALVPALLLVASSAWASPTALDVGPPDPPVFMALSGVGALERQADEFVAYMERVGLEDPGLATLRKEALATLKRRRGSLVGALGLDPAGAVALYVVRTPANGMHPVFAADLSDRRAFVDALAMLQESDQWVPPNQEPAKAVVDRRSLPGGGLEVTVALPDRRGVTARIQDGVAVLSDFPDALDIMHLGGDARPAIADRLTRDDARVTGVFAMSPAAIAATEPGSPPAMAMIERVEAVGSMGPGGIDLWANGRFSAELTPFLKVGFPGPAGADARAAMRALAGRGTSMWWRWSFDVAAAWELAGTMLGDARRDVVRDMKDETGLDLQRDLVEVFTGDLMLTCQEGSLDCVLVAGARDTRRAAASLKKALKVTTRSDDTRGVNTRARRLDAGRTLYSSTFVSQSPDSDEPEDLFRIHWGTRDHALVMGFTSHGVEAALRRELEPAQQVPAVVAGRGFSDQDVMAGYQLVQEPSNLVRQILPLLRGVLPGTNAGGIATRAVDTYMALQDRVVDSGVLLEADGLSWTLRAQSRTVPTEGAEDWNPEWARRFEEALRLRYQGRLRSSNEALLELSDAAPGTPWALKGRAYALAGDDLGALLMAGTAMLRYMLPGATMFTDAARPPGVSAAPTP